MAGSIVDHSILKFLHHDHGVVKTHVINYLSVRIMTTSSPQQQAPPSPIIEDLEWEEWDSTGGLSFTHHCLAGSFAGVAEHTLLYPLDTVKTCWQSQVLHRAAGGGNNIATGCDPCSVHQTVNKLAHNNSQPSAAAAAALQSSTGVTNSSSNKETTTAVVSSQQQQHQSIWSTMKHLMRHGSHHHHHAPTSGRPAANVSHHAHVTTLSEASSSSMAAATTTQNHHLAPNVVDLTNTNNSKLTTTTAGNERGGGGGGKKQHRPWSKSARIGRGATFHDIAPSLQPSLYHSSSSSSSSVGGADTTTSAAIVNNNSNRHNHTGFKRLWRGVQTMFVGCIPAHALYFSSYEGIKSICLDHNHKINSNNSTNDGGGNNGETTTSQQHHVGIDTLSPMQAMVAGGVATLLHDFIMTPMDTMKQRMQLGHYYNLRDAFCSIVWGDRQVATNTIQEGVGVRMGGEGWKGLYRSFPITVMTNVPYGMIMMTTNEWLRAVLEDGIYGFHEHHHHHGDEKPFHFVTILLSGMGAGTVASALTAPLDRVKTRLQTQRMGMMIPSVVEGGGGVGGAGGGGAVIMEERALAAAMGERKVCPKMAVQDVKSALFPSAMSSSPTVTSSSSSSMIGVPSSSSIPRPTPSLAQSSPFTKTYYTTPIEAFQSILQEEGPRGLFRGALPRVALHAPSVAISWTAYEMAKGWLLWLQ